MMRNLQRIFVMIMLCTFIMFILCGCGDTEIEKTASKTAAIFSSGNIEEINNLVFSQCH